MKVLKNFALVAAVVIPLFLFLGRLFDPDDVDPYRFRQDFDQIESIEILKKTYDSIRTDTPVEVLKTLDVEEHQLMIDAILATEGSYVGMAPSTGFGLYIIRITYKNGEAEMIGNYNNGYISPEGEVYEYSYRFDREQFLDLLSRFLGKDVTSLLID